jgi:hypothetical protein
VCTAADATGITKFERLSAEWTSPKVRLVLTPYWRLRVRNDPADSPRPLWVLSRDCDAHEDPYGD